VSLAKATLVTTGTVKSCGRGGRRRECPVKEGALSTSQQSFNTCIASVEGAKLLRWNVRNPAIAAETSAHQGSRQGGTTRLASIGLQCRDGNPHGTALMMMAGCTPTTHVVGFESGAS
jgi:hypothetical protein